MGIVNTEEFQRDELEQAGVILNGHFVLDRGEHSEVYVDKQAIRDNIKLTASLCEGAVNPFRFRKSGFYVDVIVTPSVAGVHFLYPLVEALERLNLGVGDGSRKGDIMPVRADRMMSGDEFCFDQRAANLVRGAKVLVFSGETLTSGCTAQQLCELVEAHGGEIVGVTTFIKRSKLTAEELSVPMIVSDFDLDVRFWEKEEDCALCKRKRNRVPVNPDYGSGAEFLAENGNKKKKDKKSEQQSGGS